MTVASLRTPFALLLALSLGAAVVSAQQKPASEGLAVGKPMADFGLRALDLSSGKLKKIVWLSDFVGKKPGKTPKKLVLLNFFATWCKPCMAELPVLDQMQRSYGDRGLQILSVNFRAEGEKFDATLSESLERLRPATPTFPVLFDRYTNRNQLLYMGGKASLPCNILIGADGKVIARFQGGAETELALLEQRVKKELGVTE